MEYSNYRNPHHDYASKSIYLVTINKGEGIPDFSRCYDDPALMNSSCPGVVSSFVGNAIKRALRKLNEDFPFTKLIRYIVMPDHIHFILEYLVKADTNLGEIIANFKTGIRKELGMTGVFTPGFHDRILRHKGQLNRMRNYVLDNPRRRVLMRRHPEYFRKPHIINLYGRDYVAYGNFLLLREPVISAVKESSKYTEEQRANMREDWLETIRSNGVLVSPFIHTVEKNFRDKGVEGGASLIHITREKIRERFKPSGRYFDLCAQGRLLIISSQKEATGERLSKKEADELNLLARRLVIEPLPVLRLRKLRAEGP